MLHFKSYNALQMTKEEDPKLKDYRVGLVVHTRDGTIKRFTNLNEAVTEELTKQNTPALFPHALFAKEIKQTQELQAQYPDMTSRSGEPFFDDDTFYAEIYEENDERVRFVRETFSYHQERNMLYALIDKLFERNKERFADNGDVFDVFARAAMTGNILPMGKLIDETFGRGTLRKIGNFDGDKDRQKEFIDSL